MKEKRKEESERGKRDQNPNNTRVLATHRSAERLTERVENPKHLNAWVVIIVADYIILIPRISVQR